MLMLEHGSFWMWVKRQKIPMSRFEGHFVLGDLHKFCEHYGDVIGWDLSNRSYISMHGISALSGPIIVIRCLSTCMKFICNIGGMSNSPIEIIH